MADVRGTGVAAWPGEGSQVNNNGRNSQSHTTNADLVWATNIADELRREFETGAIRRDADREFATACIERLKSSGLLGLCVPREFGGRQGGFVELFGAVSLISQADPNIGQMLQVHNGAIWLLKEVLLKADANRDSASDLLKKIAEGTFFSNAYSEVGTKTVADVRTTIAQVPGTDTHVVNGQKHYCTGSLGADWLFGLAADPADGRHKIFFTPVDVDGLTIEDNWDAIGQRTTASGTIDFANVVVPSELVIDIEQTVRPYSTVALLYQTVHIAVFVGIGKAAVADAALYLSEKSRPWYEAEVDSAASDPFALRNLGLIQADVWAAEAMAFRAAEFCQMAEDEQAVAPRGEASVRTGAARQVAIEAALNASNLLFKICGTSSIQSKYGFDRHWRNVRSLSLHNPMDWKLKRIGEFAALGTLPPVDAFN